MNYIDTCHLQSSIKQAPFFIIRAMNIIAMQSNSSITTGEGDGDQTAGKRDEVITALRNVAAGRDSQGYEKPPSQSPDENEAKAMNDDDDDDVDDEDTEIAEDDVETEEVTEAASSPALGGSSSKKRKTWKKPEGMPKRPLSAYNIFFRRERKEILGEEIAKEFEITDQSKRKHRKTHGMIGFAEMARTISNKWKSLTAVDKKPYLEKAEIEKAKYLVAVEEWKKSQKETTKRVSIDLTTNLMPQPQSQLPTTLNALQSYRNMQGMVDLTNYSPSATHVTLMDMSERSLLPSMLDRQGFDRASLINQPPAVSAARRLSMQQNLNPALASNLYQSERERLLKLEEAYNMHMRKARAIKEELQRAANDLPGLAGASFEQHNNQVGNSARAGASLPPSNDMFIMEQRFAARRSHSLDISQHSGELMQVSNHGDLSTSSRRFLQASLQSNNNNNMNNNWMQTSQRGDTFTGLQQRDSLLGGGGGGNIGGIQNGNNSMAQMQPQRRDSMFSLGMFQGGDLGMSRQSSQVGDDLWQQEQFNALQTNIHQQQQQQQNHHQQQQLQQHQLQQQQLHQQQQQLQQSQHNARSHQQLQQAQPQPQDDFIAGRASLNANNPQNQMDPQQLQRLSMIEEELLQLRQLRGRYSLDNKWE